jgi:SAM-dependent methyltransferase
MTEHARSGPSGLELPASLFEALGRPRRLELAPDEHGNVAVRPEPRVRALARIVPPLRGPWTDAARLADGEGGRIRYATSRPLPEASLGIANYERFFLLMPVEGAHRASREESWRQIRDYHEHRPPDRQDESALRVSEWLARDVLIPLAADGTYLEVGCGAGRNLLALATAAPSAALRGLDINAAAVAEARRTVPTAAVEQGSLYELAGHADASADVVFTSGVLMHVPADALDGVVREMHRIAARAVVHFELHGPSHPFDFHRYPRDYAAVYERLGLPVVAYTVFPRGDFRSSTPSFRHALLVSA